MLINASRYRRECYEILGETNCRNTFYIIAQKMLINMYRKYSRECVIHSSELFIDNMKNLFARKFPSNFLFAFPIRAKEAPPRKIIFLIQSGFSIDADETTKRLFN